MKKDQGQTRTNHLHIVVLDARLPDERLQLDQLDGLVDVPVGEVESLDTASSVRGDPAEDLAHDPHLVALHPAPVKGSLGTGVLGLGYVVKSIDRVSNLVLKCVISRSITSKLSILVPLRIVSSGLYSRAGLLSLEPSGHAGRSTRS